MKCKRCGKKINRKEDEFFDLKRHHTWKIDDEIQQVYYLMGSWCEDCFELMWNGKIPYKKQGLNCYK